MGLIVIFSIYNVDTGGTALWSEQQAVTVNNGIYSVVLGQVNAINLLFDVPYFLGVRIGSDSEMTPRQPLTSVGYSMTSDYADNSGDADTVDSRHASELDQAAHTLDTGNPHNITVAQIGAVSSTNFTSHALDSSVHHTRYTNSEAQSAMGVMSDSNPLNHARYADADVLNAVINNDGAGSGVDADTVDGQHASEIMGQNYLALEAKINCKNS